MKIPRQDNPLRLWLLLFPLTLLLPILGCNPVRPEPTPGPQSTIDLDENTDPRLFWEPRNLSVRIKAVGPQVRVDGRPVGYGNQIPNGSFVSTGYGSKARIEFNRASRGGCTVIIRDYRRGALYGATENCVHQLNTPHGSAQSEQLDTVYLVATNPYETEIALLSGSLALRMPGRTLVRARMRANQYAVLAPGREFYVRELDRPTRARMGGWRIDFPPNPSAPPSRNPPGGDDAQRVISDIIKAFIDNRQRGNARTPNTTPSPQYPGSSTPQPPGITQPPPGSGRQPRPYPPIAVDVQVPDLSRKTREAASAMLSRLGLRVQVNPSYAAPDYWVLSQSPQSGTRVKKGSTVTINVSPPIK